MYSIEQYYVDGDLSQFVYAKQNVVIFAAILLANGGIVTYTVLKTVKWMQLYPCFRQRCGRVLFYMLSSLLSSFIVNFRRAT
jgi:hypothetical protein